MSTRTLDQAIPVRSGGDFAAQRRDVFLALRPANSKAEQPKFGRHPHPGALVPPQPSFPL
jgi:hypothetical protein